MPYRKKRFKRRKKHREMPSLSRAVYTHPFSISLTTTDGSTKVGGSIVSQIKDLETQNRKLASISGTLAMNSNNPAAIMFAHHIGPEVQDFPPTGFDPFSEGPTGGADAYSGRPSPRPFGRRDWVSGVGIANDVEIVNHVYRFRQGRNFYPGDNLRAYLWVRRLGSSNVTVNLYGCLRYAVLG